MTQTTSSTTARELKLLALCEIREIVTFRRTQQRVLWAKAIESGEDSLPT